MAIEFPESTMISSQMREVLPGRAIERVVIRDAAATVFRWGFSNLDKLDISGQVITGIRQFGDFIFVEMDAYSITFGDMIGRILYHRPGEKRLPKSAIIMELNDGAAFSYNPSLYGYCKALTPAEVEKIAPLTWVQPLDKEFTADYLSQAFAEPERKIAKQMNVFKVKNKVIGVGNGYWQDILYRCGIHPQRKSKAILPEEIERLHSCTREVMEMAVDLHGSAEECDFYGVNGRYVRAMGGKLKGQPCPNCGEEIVGKNILGANVYFCPVCQK